MELLKFITCGSVDDGKSTLIGHILYDSKLIFADQKQALELESKVGSREGELDYSLLLDGLMAEREQGITIDVAYRYFSTKNRSFIVADCPGHEEYTRNMAVGASFAELAIILVDATKGVIQQTKRHARICAMMGIKNIVLAVNKMDLVNYDKHTYEKIRDDFYSFCGSFEFDGIEVIPVSATAGDNLTKKSINTAWYQGEPLLPHLEKVEVGQNHNSDDFYMTIQRVSRPNHTFRGFQGEIGSGKVNVGDKVTVLPSGEEAVIKQMYSGFKDVDLATKGQPVSIALDREIDISRGSVLVKDNTRELTDLFTADILWMDNEKLVPGRNYLLKCGTKLIPATVMDIKYKIDINTGNHEPTEGLFKNEIAVCDLSLSEKIVVDKFSNEPALGSFILIDRVTNMTSACGVIEHTLRRSENVVWQDSDITREIRANQKNQVPQTIWLTGLSGSGKSTVANALEKKLVSLGKHTVLLDGDNIRHGLNRDLGFKESDRVENIRRISEVAKLMNEAGLIVITSFISPFEKDRKLARDIIGESYQEIYISTPLEECEKRDVKGLYKKARSGDIPNFTGISSPYEKPSDLTLAIDTTDITVDEAVEKIMKKLGEIF